MTINLYKTEITRQHFVKADEFLRAATWAGLFPIEPDEVLMAAAKNGIFPKNSFSFKYKPISPFRENAFEKRPYSIRHANEEDLSALAKIEKDCWPKYLQASSELILRRISNYPEGNCIFEVENRIIGVIYSQRIKNLNDINNITMDNISSIHSDDGRIIQLLSISILPEARHFGPGDQLLEYMLQYSSMKSDVDKIVTVSLCKDYRKYSYMTMEKYIRKRNSNGELIDEILRFHESHGGKIKGIIPGYRPFDIDNLFNGVLIEYEIKNLKDRNISLPDLIALNDVKPESIKTIVEECIYSVLPGKKYYSPKKTLKEMGVDSIHIIRLRALLKQRIGFEPDSNFFFYYKTPESIINFFEQTHEAASSYSEDTNKNDKTINKIFDSIELDSINEFVKPYQSEKEFKTNIFPINLIENEPIAVIGMSCRFPGAENIDKYWNILKNGINTISKVPIHRWDYEKYLNNTTDIKKIESMQFGGFLNNIDLFDSKCFNIMPREASQMDPQQRILLEQTWKALENAGINPKSLKGTQTGVFVGIYTHDYETLRAKQLNDKDIDIYYATGNSSSIAAGRLSYFYGVHGPCFSVDTACSSSFVAIHQACQSLRNNECNIALAGGVNLILSPEYSIAFSKSGMLAKDGLCKTFDAKADGYVRSEGCGAVVLKTLSKALADNDNILAVIKGSAVNQDGASNGITAPNGLAQEKVINQALSVAGISPHDVSYVETHGTGTLLGDPVEVQAVKSVFGKGRSEKKPLIIGSVKTNIGHTESASGIAGLIKVILSMKNQYIPKHLHFKTLNPFIKLDNSSIQIPTSGIKWKSENNKLIAGISSFGFSGTNVHVIIENYKKSSKSIKIEDNKPNLFVLSARTNNSLKQYAKKYVSYLKSTEDSLSEICYTSATGRAHFNYRSAVTVDSKNELKTYLENLNDSEIKNTLQIDKKSNKLTFLFTGQGSQYHGMGNFLYKTQPVFKNAMNQCNEILKQYLKYQLLDIIYSQKNELSSLINNTEYTQPALFAIEYSLAQLLKSWGIIPNVVIGHSVGEYVAACVSGVFDLENGLKLTAERARLMQALPKNGKMAVIFSNEQIVNQHIKPFIDKVSIAAINGVENVVISGEKNSVITICNNIKRHNLNYVYLNVSHAFHSPCINPMLDNFKKIVSSVSFSLPNIDLVSNLTGKIETDKFTEPEYWVNHAISPVKFSDSIDFLNKNGCKLFVEIGPKPVLIGMAKRCLPKNSSTWLSCMDNIEDNSKKLLQTTGKLYTFGIDIDWNEVYKYVYYKIVELPTTPFDRQRYWIEQNDNTSQVQNNSMQIFEKTNNDNYNPLLGKQIRCAALNKNEFIFESELHKDFPDFISHHIVYDKILMPATGFIETALAAGKYFFNSDNIIVNNFLIQRPLIIEDNKKFIIQSIITQKQKNEISIKTFSSSDDNQDKWTEHASAVIKTIEKINNNFNDDFYSLRSNIKNETPINEHYKKFKNININFGSFFQRVDQLWLSENEAFGKITLPYLTDNKYLFHPVLLDACIQIAWNLLPFNIEEKSEKSWLPVAIDSFEVCLNPDLKVWSYAKINEINEFSKDITFDFVIFDDDGNIQAKINRLAIKQVNREILLKNTGIDINRLLYNIQWQPSLQNDIKNSFQFELDNKWLIFADISKTGNFLADLIYEQGNQSIIVNQGDNFKKIDINNYQINPLSKKDYDQVISDCLPNKKIKGIIFLWGINNDFKTNFSYTEAFICSSVSYLIQSINVLIDQPKLFLITKGIQAVENNSINLEGSSIWGLGRIIDLEHPNFKCTLIDLENDSFDKQNALQIFNEIKINDNENQIVYRKNSRYIARFNTQNIETKKSDPYRLMTYESGTLDNIKLEPVKRRMPDKDEVEIRVLAAGLNYKDVLKALGMIDNNQPTQSDNELLFGLECAGIIESVGDNESIFKIGDKVIALHAPGCFGNFVTVKANLVVFKPENLSFAEAATLPIVFLTAWYSLNKLAKIKKGDKVLVQSAAGGVGQAAIQIIKRAGGQIYATASSEKKEFLKLSGIEHVMNSRTLDFFDEIKNNHGKVDIVLNSLNGDYIPKCIDIINSGGTYIEIGKVGIWSNEQVKERNPDISYYYFDLEDLAISRPDFVRTMFNEILAEFENASLKPLPTKSFPISEISEAFRYMARSKHIGKIVITFPENNIEITDITSFEKSSYLITGGFGALGLEAANWIINKGGRHIILTGRTEPSEQSLKTINKVKENGAQILSLFGDISNIDHVNNIINTIKDTMPPLKGIIHAAGINEDAVITRQNFESFQRVMLSKIDGSWNLHSASKDIPLDFFVCFSSFSSIIGWPGQSNYAAANSFMDSLINYRHSLGLPGTSINWGPWGKAGMAARLEKNLREKFDAKGIQSINSDLNLLVMEKLLNKGLNNSVVIDIDWQKYLKNYDIPLFDNFRKKTNISEKNEHEKPLIKKLKKALPGELKKILTSYIRSKLAIILGIKKPEKIHARERLFNAGMDSLMAIEFKNQLESDFGLIFRNSLLFDYPTVESLVDYLKDIVIAPENIELDDDEKSEDDDIDLLLSEIDGMSEDDIENQLIEII